jgi:hypothetical protein
MHCPQAAQPTVTFLGTVNDRGGQLNNGSTLLHYRMQTTVYNNSTRTNNTFPITAYFKNGQRWAKFPLLTPNTQVIVTGRIFGMTTENRQLAVITDDIHFLPMATKPYPLTPSSTTPKREQQDRWTRRAPPRTPSKQTNLPQPDVITPNQTDSAITTQTPDKRARSASPEDDQDTQITWEDSADEVALATQLNTPTPERRSKRARKTSYADILSNSTNI